jgi:starch-binding outer membrane protein, SusD/RagB family
MKNILYLFLLAFSLLIVNPGCKKDFPNLNAASSDEILKTREGMFSLSVAIKQYYSTSAFGPLLITTGCTSREIKGISTLANVIDIEKGGSDLPNDNSNVGNLFANNLRVMSMAESLIANAPTVLASDVSTQSGILAHAKLFKAMAIGALATGFEQCPINSDKNGKATYVPRLQALQSAIQLLDEASSGLAANAPSTEFNTRVQGADFKLVDCINAYKARFNLMAGNYANAKTAASLVPANSKSVFFYSSTSSNPAWNSLGGASPAFRARENFGLPVSIFEPGDTFRLAFYTIKPLFTSGTETLKTIKGFFDVQTVSIPMYLPDEMRLIKAECILRGSGLGALADAVTEINAVRTQSSGDIFGVNANLPAYSGATDAPSLLLEVYKQRCSELFLQGLRLEDSRRFNRVTPVPNTPPPLGERSRNYYAYPANEKTLNPNTPADPAI